MGDKDVTRNVPDSKVHGANMGPIWVLTAPGGFHVGLMNLSIWGKTIFLHTYLAVNDK